MKQKKMPVNAPVQTRLSHSNALAPEVHPAQIATSRVVNRAHHARHHVPTPGKPPKGL